MWLRREIARRGLGDRLSVREGDFREVDGPYDKVVSIGVLEHAGVRIRRTRKDLGLG